MQTIRDNKLMAALTATALLLSMVHGQQPASPRTAPPPPLVQPAVLPESIRVSRRPARAGVPGLWSRLARRRPLRGRLTVRRPRTRLPIRDCFARGPPRL
jgi:hypothetical protein